MAGAEAATGASDGGDLAGDPGTDASTDPVEDARPRLVRFALGASSYLIGVDAVREVLVATPCRRLPGSARAVIGVTSVRGRIVAVIDPRPALGAEGSRADPGQLLVVTTPDGHVALHVDRVDDVVPAEPDPLDPAPGPDVPVPMVVASACVDGTVLAVLDPAALVLAALRVGAGAGAGAGGSS